MSFFKGDASEVYKLGADLSACGAKATLALRAPMEGAGEALAKEWASNARETSGSHAKFYPDSIDSQLVFDTGGISVDAGPNRAKKQGFLGHILEFGGEHSSPHLDGLRALDGVQDRVERIIDAAVGHILP